MNFRFFMHILWDRMILGYFFYIPFFQLQTAVAEMEKALGTPSHVMIYKQYWDYYFKAPALLEKLKLEQSIMVAQDTSRREGAVSATPSNATLDTDRSGSVQTGQSFAAQYHLGNSVGEDSSIRAELEQYISYSKEQTNKYESTSVLLDRSTPMMFSQSLTCARMSAGGLLVKVEPRIPQQGHSLAAILRNTKESQELEMFPGPLKPGVTYKRMMSSISVRGRWPPVRVEGTWRSRRAHPVVGHVGSTSQAEGAGGGQ